jgi:hypothetical protein
MQVERVTKPSQVLQIWGFFQDGLLYLQNVAREHFDTIQMQKLMCGLAADSQHGYIGVVFDDEGEPCAFGVAQETTLPYGQERAFEIRAVYHRPTTQESVLLLMGNFENWCRENHIKRYSITTRRNTGATIRCFRHERYGFKKPFLVFEKDVPQ